MFVCIIRCRQCVPCLLLPMEKNILVCIMCVVFCEQFLEPGLQRCTLVTGMKLIFVLISFLFFFFFFSFLLYYVFYVYFFTLCVCNDCIGMELIPVDMAQNPSRMLPLLNMLILHMPDIMNSPEWMRILKRMRQMDAIRRDQWFQRRYQTLLAIGNESRM